MPDKKTLVLGASDNPSRYSNMAINRLVAKDYEVEAIGRKKTVIAGVQVETGKEALKNIDTVTLYLNADNQKEYYDYILSLNPKRIIFNPGAENEAFATMAKDKGIETLEACTLVLLSTGQY